VGGPIGAAAGAAAGAGIAGAVADVMTGSEKRAEEYQEVRGSYASRRGGESGGCVYGVRA
jgi:hypothetical protein